MAIDFEMIFLDSPVPAMVLDRELKFVTANYAYRAMVGKSADDLIGHYVFDVFPETPERVAAMRAIFLSVFEGERPVFEEFQFAIDLDGRNQDVWWTARHAPVLGDTGEIRYMVQYSENVTQEVRFRTMKDAVMGELQHRIGNYFSIVNALATQVARSATDTKGFLHEFRDRLATFFTAQQDLAPGRSGASRMQEVMDQQLSVFARDGKARVEATGPDLPLSAIQAQAVSMMVHELGTNSLKYGALSAADGRLNIQWSATRDGAGFDLLWRETGFEPGAEQTKSGYGTLLLTSILPSQLGGVAERVLEGGVFEYRFRMTPQA